MRTISVPSLGISVTPMTALETANWVTGEEGKRLLLNHNLHSAYLHIQDAGFRSFYQRADRVVIDGAPILWLARRHQNNLTMDFRIGSTDWIERLAEVTTPGRLFVYGATAESNERAVSRLRDRLQAKGWSVEGKNGFADQAEVLEWLRLGEPTLVIVGLGMPLQEHFLESTWEELPNATYATVGGAIDYVAGMSVLAPRWMGRLGLEWLWRLVHDPLRLAGRYLVEPIRLVLAVIGRHYKKR